MMATEQYLAPRTIDEVLGSLGQGNAAIVAGGTDLLPRWAKGLLAKPEVLISLKAVEGLKGVARVNGEVRLGAYTTMSEIARDPIIRLAAPVLAYAADRIGCSQVRNRATVGGNLCNASPAADTAIPLILLDAALELASLGPRGLATRRVPVAEFFRGPGSIVLGRREMLTHIWFRDLPAGVFAAWEKFGTRPAMEIAVASVGVALHVEDGTVTRARVAYGSVAPVPLRGRKAEIELVGKPLCEEVIERCRAAACEEIAPITDVRASAAYRREMVGVMLRRMLEGARRD